MLCFSTVNSRGVICRVQSITIKESFKPPYRCQRIKLQAGEVLWKHCFFTLSFSFNICRIHLPGSLCLLHLKRIKLVVWKILGLTEFNLDEKIPGQRKTCYCFSLSTFHLTLPPHLLTLFSHLSLTSSFFRHCTYPDMHISLRTFQGHRKVWKLGPTIPSWKWRNAFCWWHHFLPTPTISNLINWETLRIWKELGSVSHPGAINKSNS